MAKCMFDNVISRRVHLHFVGRQVQEVLDLRTMMS